MNNYTLILLNGKKAEIKADIYQRMSQNGLVIVSFYRNTTNGPV